MNTSLFFGVLLLALASSGASVAEDTIAPVQSDDPQMLAAIHHARSTLGDFFSALASPRPGQKSFLLKVAFSQGESVEHIWLADLDLSGPRPRGVVANEPRIAGLHFKQSVEFDPKYISDWMYIENGKLVGGFTTRLLRDRMSAEERKKLDAESSYAF